MFPQRYTDLDQIALHGKHGPRADKLAPYLLQGDALADDLVALFSRLPPKRGAKLLEAALENGIDAVPEAPKPLRDFFAQIDEPPLWLDRHLLDVGSRTQMRCGIVMGLVLGCSCLPMSYRSGAGVKPLMFTGDLHKRSVRRMSETNRFIIETCKPGGLDRNRPGWKITIRVRLMHAQMRRLLTQGQRRPWREDAWGVPINQTDLAATLLLFSAIALEHMRRVGFHFSAEESEGVMHLWRYSGYLSGIVPELLCATEAEGRRMFTLLIDMAGRPDPDSHKLVEALMGVALPMHVGAMLPWLVPLGDVAGQARAQGRMFRSLQDAAGLLGIKVSPETFKQQVRLFCYGLSQGILGTSFSADLNFPATAWTRTAPLLLRTLIAPLETCRRLIPGATRLAAHLGQLQIDRLMQSKLFARPTTARRDDFSQKTKDSP